MCRSFQTGLQRQLRRLEAYLGPWRKGFGSWYPSGDEGGDGPTALRMQIAQRGPQEYRCLVFEMPLGELLLYLETRRVGKAFQDMGRGDGHAGGAPPTLDGPAAS